jgi:hypothetical protein
MRELEGTQRYYFGTEVLILLWPMSAFTGT